MAEDAKAKEPTFGLYEMVFALRDNPGWKYQRDIIEKRVEQIKRGLLRPAADVADVLQMEREKGAAIALETLLVPYTVSIDQLKERGYASNSDQRSRGDLSGRVDLEQQQPGVESSDVPHAIGPEPGSVVSST